MTAHELLAHAGHGDGGSALPGLLLLVLLAGAVLLLGAAASRSSGAVHADDGPPHARAADRARPGMPGGAA